jgi:hypothetical protein
MQKQKPTSPAKDYEPPLNRQFPCFYTLDARAVEELLKAYPSDDNPEQDKE